MPTVLKTIIGVMKSCLDRLIRVPTGAVNAALERFVEARDSKSSQRGHQQGYLT